MGVTDLIAVEEDLPHQRFVANDVPPLLEKGGGASSRLRVSRISAVCGDLGPSSKVSATFLPALGPSKTAPPGRDVHPIGSRPVPALVPPLERLAAPTESVGASQVTSRAQSATPRNSGLRPAPLPRQSPALLTIANLVSRDEESLEALAKPRRRGNEMPSARGHQSLRMQLGRKCVGRALEKRGVVAGGDQCRDARAAQDIEFRACVGRRTTAVSATNGLDDVLRKRPAIRNRRTRDPQELSQRCGVRIQATVQDFIAHALKAFQLGIVRYQVEKWRLDQRQRPHLCRAAYRRNQGSKRSVGVCDHVGAPPKQRYEVSGVKVEVLTPAGGRWAGGKAPSVNADQPPATPQGLEPRPRRRRARAAMNEQNLRPLALAGGHDLS